MYDFSKKRAKRKHHRRIQQNTVCHEEKKHKISEVERWTKMKDIQEKTYQSYNVKNS